MPLLNKKLISSIDVFQLDKHKLDAYTLNGLNSTDIYTKSLLHFNGINGSTSFADETGKAWTAHGNAKIDTSQKKFGTASGYFDGAGSYIDTPGNDDFYVGSSDFTIDFGVKRGTVGTDQFIFGQNGTTMSGGSMLLKFMPDNTVVFYVPAASFKSVGSSTSISDTNWHHIAVVRYNNTITLYIDGVSKGTGNFAGITLPNLTDKFAIGRTGEQDSYYFNGYIDEFRFSKGIARWTANFTPPTAEYTS